jgi:uncharacterized protein Yka (UPF0111/DUF47 family)
VTTADAIRATLISPNESDRNLEAANVVDGLFAIARAINRLADAAETAGESISEKLNEIASQIDEVEQDLDYFRRRQIEIDDNNR